MEEVVEERVSEVGNTLLGDTIRTMFDDGANITISRILFDEKDTFLSESRYVFGGGGRIQIGADKIVFRGTVDGKGWADELLMTDISNIGLDGTSVEDAKRLSFVEHLDSSGRNCVVSIIKNSDLQQE